MISGFGDTSVSAIYSPWLDMNSWWSRLSFNTGFILPTGEARDNPRTGASAPSIFQLGTGTTQLTLGTNYFGTLNDDWSYFTSLDISLPLSESSNDFRAAQTSFFRVGTSRLISDSLTAKLSLDLFNGKKDEFQGEKVGYTGSTVLSLTPSIVYSINDNLRASASVALPAYRRVNETALVVGPLWSFGLSCSF